MKNYITIGVLLTIISIVLYNYLYTKERNFKTFFKGKIFKIEYDAKNQPTVYIGDKAYSFPFGREKDEFMIGDSLVKRSNSRLLYQYRKNVLINEYEF